MRETIMWFIIIIGMVLISQCEAGEYVHPPVPLNERMAAPDRLGHSVEQGVIYVRDMSGHVVATVDLSAKTITVNGMHIPVNGYYSPNQDGPTVPLNTDDFRSVVIGLGR
jgi:hypothetical protein